MITLSLNVPAKEFWKSTDIRQRYGEEYSVPFLTHDALLRMFKEWNWSLVNFCMDFKHWANVLLCYHVRLSQRVPVPTNVQQRRNFMYRVGQKTAHGFHCNNFVYTQSIFITFGTNFDAVSTVKHKRANYDEVYFF